MQFNAFQEGPGVECKAFDAVGAAVEEIFLCSDEILQWKFLSCIMREDVSFSL